MTLLPAFVYWLILGQTAYPKVARSQELTALPAWLTLCWAVLLKLPVSLYLLIVSLTARMCKTIVLYAQTSCWVVVVQVPFAFSGSSRTWLYKML